MEIGHEGLIWLLNVQNLDFSMLSTLIWIDLCFQITKILSLAKLFLEFHLMEQDFHSVMFFLVQELIVCFNWKTRFFRLVWARIWTDVREVFHFKGRSARPRFWFRNQTKKFFFRTEWHVRKVSMLVKEKLIYLPLKLVSTFFYLMLMIQRYFL